MAGLRGAGTMQSSLKPNEDRCQANALWGASPVEQLQDGEFDPPTSPPVGPVECLDTAPRERDHRTGAVAIEDARVDVGAPGDRGRVPQLLGHQPHRAVDGSLAGDL